VSKPIDRAQAILSSKGENLMQDDFDAVWDIFMEIPPEEWDDVLRLMEGVVLVVNSPEYNGDIPPIF
jgi:hypothetical protein